MNIDLARFSWKEKLALFVRSWRTKISTSPYFPVIVTFIWVASIATILVTSYFFYKTNFSEEENENIWSPTKTTPRPLASGRQTYTISGSTEGAPKISEVTINPLDPAINTSQDITVKVLGLNGKPVSQVSVTIITDNGSKTSPLSLTSGTNTDGTWTGNWTINDTYDYTYQAMLEAKNDEKATEIVLTFR